MASIADHFAPAREVVCVDLYADLREPAGPPADSTTISGAAREILRQATTSVREPFVLVAHSWGSRAAMQAWRWRPDLVCGLVLIDDSRMGGTALEGHPLLARDAFVRRLGDDPEAGMQQFLRAFIDDCFVAGCTPDSVRDAMTAQMGRLPVDWARAAFISVAEWDNGRLTDTLGALAAASVPVLVVQATYLDADYRRASLREAAQSPWIGEVSEMVGHAEISVVTGSGHFVQLEHPRAVNGCIGAWLARSVDGGEGHGGVTDRWRVQ